MNLCNLMLERGITLRDLADLINVTEEDARRKLQGTLSWDLTEVAIICNHFKTVDIGLFGVQFDSNT